MALVKYCPPSYGTRKLYRRTFSCLSARLMSCRTIAEWDACNKRGATFSLTLAQMRSWNKRGGLRKFMARGGCIRVCHHYMGFLFDPNVYWLWNPEDCSYTEIKTEAEMDEAYRRVDKSERKVEAEYEQRRFDQSWLRSCLEGTRVFRIVKRVSVEDQRRYAADAVDAADFLKTFRLSEEEFDTILRDARGWIVTPNGETWEWVYNRPIRTQ
jgi:hypothetical protein